MSLARNMEAYNRTVEGSAARALPESDRAARPETRSVARPRKVSRRLIVIGIVGWAAVMLFSFALVQRNAMVQAETVSMTKLKSDLAQLEKLNQDLATRSEMSLSVTQVEKWALEHGMKRAAAAKPLNGDPAAVAVRTAPAEAVPAGEPSPAAPGFWHSVKSYVARFTGSTQTAGGK